MSKMSKMSTKLMNYSPLLATLPNCSSLAQPSPLPPPPFFVPPPPPAHLIAASPPPFRPLSPLPSPLLQSSEFRVQSSEFRVQMFPQTLPLLILLTLLLLITRTATVSATATTVSVTEVEESRVATRMGWERGDGEGIRGSEEKRGGRSRRRRGGTWRGWLKGE